MSNVETKTASYPSVKDGEVFQLAGIEFIKFPDVDGGAPRSELGIKMPAGGRHIDKKWTPVITRDIQFRSRFGDNNDLRSSDVLKKLQAEFLPKIVAAVGEENVCTFRTDLTTLDGLKPYGVMESKISLPTMEFYRENVEIFDKYPVNAWWWLATPESAKPHENPWWILCVSPSGCVRNDFHGFNCDNGVRPFLFLKSSIFESFEE